MSVRETPIRSALFEWKTAMVFPPRMSFATRTFLQMWKGKLSVLQLKNFIRTLHEFDDAHVLLIILMAKCLSEFRRSDNDSMRMGFFKMKKGDKKANSGKVEFRCDVTMPRFSLEEGALLSRSSIFSKTFFTGGAPTRMPYANFSKSARSFLIDRKVYSWKR